MTSQEAKVGLRQSHLAALREITPIQRHAWSAQIVARILQHPWWLEARVVLLYAPMPNEPDLLDLLGRGQRLIFPRVTPTGLTLHEVHATTQLIPTTRWLSEPDVATCPLVSPAEIQLALIPGLAFTRTTGVRLGRGAGYYDRLLADPKFTKQSVGVCFHSQVVAELPQEPHDLSVQEILTDVEQIDVSGNAIL